MPYYSFYFPRANNYGWPVTDGHKVAFQLMHQSIFNLEKTCV